MMADRYGSITEIARKARVGGSIARRAWNDAQFVFVHKFSIAGGKMQLALIHATEDSFGAFAPTPEDLRALDWFVIAYSPGNVGWAR